MILSQNELQEALDSGGLEFDPPLVKGQIGPTGIDLRLGPDITIFKEAPGVSLSIADGIDAIAAAQLWETHELEEHDQFSKRSIYVLEPGEFILAKTLERVTIPAHLIASVEGRSSYARLGLSMHQTAPWIHPGYSNHITLEIRNSGKYKMELTPKIDRPCQLTLFRLTSALSDDKVYKGQFQKMTTPFRVKK